ncbi:hypothetical protein [Pedobacter alpinus]|uniref:DUF559 domain-containing protein n=1 Tax=Pedobacter alpinus TaxID=1590643 RepID=A0ABW5TRV3_9SPHI
MKKANHNFCRVYVCCEIVVVNISFAKNESKSQQYWQKEGWHIVVVNISFANNEMELVKFLKAPKKQ